MRKAFTLFVGFIILVGVVIGLDWYFSNQKPVPIFPNVQPTPVPSPTVEPLPPLVTKPLNEQEVQLILIAKKELIAKHNISASTDEVRQFIRQNIDIKEWQFDYDQEFTKALLAASEEVAIEGKDSTKVAEAYAKKWGDFRFWFSSLSQVKKENIDSMRQHLFSSYEEMIEKNINEWRNIVEERALANVILSPTENASPAWREYLLDTLLRYEKEKNKP